jgi:hypothetical protein
MATPSDTICDAGRQGCSFADTCVVFILTTWVRTCYHFYENRHYKTFAVFAALNNLSTV